MVGIVQEKGNLPLGIVAKQAEHIATVGTVHTYKIVVAVIIIPSELSGGLTLAGNAPFGQKLLNWRIDRIANLFIGGSR